MGSNQSPREYSGWRKWREIIQVWGLVIPGFAGILIAIASPFFPQKDLVLSALLFLFSILAIAIGLERYDAIGEERREAQRRHKETAQSFDILDKDVTEVYKTLRQTAVEFKLLRNNDELYDEGERLIKQCKGSGIIRATGPVHYPDINNPSSAFRGYLETIAKEVGQAKQQKLDLVYKVVLAPELDEKGELPSDVDIQAGIHNRRELFKATNALDRLYISYLNSPLFVYLLAAGDEGLIIGFSTTAGDPTMRSGISVTNKDFIAKINRWYDEYILPKAKRV